MIAQHFEALLELAKDAPLEYQAGYEGGLRRRYQGEAFGTPEQHALRMRIGLASDHRKDYGQGYRDGFAGKIPRQIQTQD